MGEVGPSPRDLAIDVRGLEKRFGGVTAVNGVDLQVPKGMIYGFLGPNGSGKTTTLRMLCGLLKPDGGSGTRLRYDIHTEAREIKRRIGYMTQKFSFYEDLTVEENLNFVARVYNIPDRARTVGRIMEDLDLACRRNQKAGQLSGGWKQRVALAACLSHDPALLLLDEPTAGVDPEARRSFWNIIHRLASQGITVLVTTHYMDEVERCHRITYLAGGRVVTSGTPREVSDRSGLVAFAVSGAGLDDLRQTLGREKAIRGVSALGAQIVVTGRDREAMERALAHVNAGHLSWEQIPPSFEDVFVELIHQATESQGKGAWT
ncbi:MAG: ABC transporter ATP-binding protein [Alphaproteobacteria bacterium]|nr:MAG: ABC transporter ATP-binding protein [Alphaproteobacteria bacterium]